MGRKNALVDQSDQYTSIQVRVVTRIRRSRREAFGDLWNGQRASVALGLDLESKCVVHYAVGRGPGTNMVFLAIYRVLPSLSGVPRVVPRFGSNEFAVVASSESKTLVRVHQVTRPEPLRTRMLPFSVDRIGCLQARRSTTDFTLVVLGKDGTTYLVGDHVSLPKQEGSVERSLAQKEHARLSLFEDVFGRSAFKDLEVEEKWTEESVDESFGASINWKLLDGPAHLIPPMETMFASLMEGVLLRRSGPEEEEVEEEEELMEIDEPVEEEQDGRRMHERNVDEKEMKMLVELFKEHAVMGEWCLDTIAALC